MTPDKLELYAKTKERFRKLGIENPADVIVCLAEENEKQGKVITDLYREGEMYLKQRDAVRGFNEHLEKENAKLKEKNVDTVKKVVERLSDDYEFDCRADIDTRTLSHSDLIEWVTQIAEELKEGL
jgi:urease gamma subunit